ncbi:MAG TPA: hypothetical protein VJL88_14515 [Nitrospira sp.]|nr:hypothetical protein [Nitrospira sp.]
MRVAAIALWIMCLGSGCGLIMIGGPVEKHDVASENDAEENLKAIRAMLADTPARGDQGKPADLSIQPSPSSSIAPSPVEPSPAARPSATPSSSATPSEVPAKLPWSPSAPDRAVPPDRPVPAYTTPAPTAPDYPGSIRCTPDGMGGQRCLGR